MNLSFEIIELHNGNGGFLYSIKLDGEKLTEYEKFLTNKDFQKCKDFKKIIGRLNGMVEKYGFREDFFEIEESGLMDNVVAAHYYKKDLRLYCIRNSNILLIVGYGGIKETKATQDDIKLQNIVDVLSYIDGRFFERLDDPHENLTMCDNGKLIGNLKFEKE